MFTEGRGEADFKSVGDDDAAPLIEKEGNLERIRKIGELCSYEEVLENSAEEGGMFFFSLPKKNPEEGKDHFWQSQKHLKGSAKWSR